MSLLVLVNANLPQCIVALSCLIVAAWILKKLPHFLAVQPKMEPRYLSEGDSPKIKTDPARILAKQVKFMMRLKRRMKSFKERKLKNLHENELEE